MCCQLLTSLYDAFAESGLLGDSLEVLAIGVAVEVEVSLQHLQLLLGEGGPAPLGLVGTAHARVHVTAVLLRICKNNKKDHFLSLPELFISKEGFCEVKLQK